MSNKLSETLQNKPWLVYVILSSLFCILFFISLWVNDRFWLNDFKVYFAAAQALQNDEPVYGVIHTLGSGFFKYAPVCLLPFIPFTYLPYEVAATLFFVLVSFAVISVPVFASKLCNRYFGLNPCALCWVVFLLIVGVHLERELHLGNVNLMVLGGVLWVLSDLLKGKQTRAGIVLGIVLLFKLHFLVLLPLLFLRKMWRPLGISVSVFGIGTLIPILYLGFSKNTELLQQWVQTIAIHNGSVELSGNTLYHWLDVTVGAFWPAFPSQMVILALVALLILFWVLKHLKSEKGRIDSSSSNLVMEWMVLVALIPNLVITDTEHFLLGAPLVYTGLVRMRRLSLSVPQRMLIIVGLILYGMNWGDLWGETSVWITENGMLGLGNALLILAFIWIGENPPQSKKTEPALV
ncbi:DUF2029 domain-containing protein [bacterium SCSIO 12741]|nr:DUF2029 domain-containing protein [bacterium SCSIO 12741]